jgi:hypothetical protein
MATVLGMALGWAAFAAGTYGYALIRGYNVTLIQLVNPRQRWAHSGGKLAAGTLAWPPDQAPNTLVLPAGYDVVGRSQDC